MPYYDHKKLRRQYDAAVKDGTPRRFFEDFQDGFKEKHLRPEDFSVRKLFEEFVENGREMVESFDPKKPGSGYAVNLLEDAGYVSTSNFSNLLGQIVYSTVMEKLAGAKLLFNEVCTVIPTSFNGEKVPGVGGIGDRAEAIGEGQPYPMAGLSQEWIETPETIKRGLLIGVTKETVFFDRTGLILRRAAEVSEEIMINREKRMLDVVFGIVNPYKRNGVAVNTYNASTPFANIKSSNALADWTDIEAANLLFDALVDPNTGEPIMVDINSIIVPTALDYTAKRIVNATEVRVGDGASATTQTISQNPVDRSLRILSSQYVKARTTSDTTWFIGDPKGAFAYMQNWGPTVETAPPNSEVEFTNDIVARWKVSERGAAAALEPRKMVKCTSG